MNYRFVLMRHNQPFEIYDQDMTQLEAARIYAEAVLENNPSVESVDILMVMETVRRKQTEKKATKQ